MRVTKYCRILTGQAEGGDKDAIFLVQSDGTLKNVIIGPNQIEGIHCMGPCTIENVWWEDVCESEFRVLLSELS